MNRNILSTVASFRVEGIKVSKEALEYSRLRDAGKVSCEEEVQRLKKRYMRLAEVK
ncbi:MAG TPA: antitoxin VbhA family protein [Epulopiscium sp.]|nr:antitoxin VbhA family protein [Candidatus Epulonipiscium sp.]